MFCNRVDNQLIIDPGFFHGNVVIRLNIVIGSVRNPNVDEGRHSRNATSALLQPPSVVSPDRISTSLLSCDEFQHSRKLSNCLFLIGVELLFISSSRFGFLIQHLRLTKSANWRVFRYSGIYLKWKRRLDKISLFVKKFFQFHYLASLYSGNQISLC